MLLEYGVGSEFWETASPLAIFLEFKSQLSDLLICDGMCVKDLGQVP